MFISPSFCFVLEILSREYSFIDLNIYAAFVVWSNNRLFVYLIELQFHSLAHSKKGPGIDLINKQCDISFRAQRIIDLTTEAAYLTACLVSSVVSSNVHSLFDSYFFPSGWCYCIIKL